MERFKEGIAQRLTARHKKALALCRVKDKRILDVGCSFGWFEKLAKEKGCREVIGLDPDKKILQLAKKQVKGVKFIKGSATNLPFGRNRFDLVVMFDTLEHLPKNLENKAFFEIKRVLKKNGEIVFSFPSNHFLAKILDPAWYFGHRHYSLEQVFQFLTKKGFEIKKVEKGGGFFEILSMILLYIFKWIFKREMPFKNFLERKREKEYFENGGFVTTYILGKRK